MIAVVLVELNFVVVADLMLPLCYYFAGLLLALTIDWRCFD